MKFILPLIALLLISGFASAQKELKPLIDPGTPGKDMVIRICAPSKGQLLHPPLYLIYSHNRLIFKSDTFANTAPLNALNPQHFKSINILKDSVSLSKYGGIAKNGVIEIYLDDEKFPDAYKAFKLDSLKVKSKNN
jgi:hypothetical protein